MCESRIRVRQSPSLGILRFHQLPKVGNCPGQPFSERCLRCPTQNVSGYRDVRLPHFGIVFRKRHRLDHSAWGLMVLAHDRKSAAGIVAQFQARSVGKTYQALVHGDLQDTLQIVAPIKGKPASSIATPVAWDQGRTLTAVAIKTGRKHQIRVHLSEIELPHCW